MLLCLVWSQVKDYKAQESHDTGSSHVTLVYEKQNKSQPVENTFAVQLRRPV